MICFVDTSAFIAILDKDDNYHAKARVAWTGLLEQKADLITTSGILLETVAIIQHRMGINAVKAFNSAIYPLLEVVWIDKDLHDVGVNSVLLAGRKKLSLVDCISFNVMRQRELQYAFTFDKHFRQQGFKSV